MGYSDIACYGGEINTPVLDEKATILIWQTRQPFE